MHPGVAYAALAYVLWGLFPLYFRALGDMPPLDVLVHRIVWSLLLLVVVLALRRQWQWLRDTVRQPRVIATFALSALLLSGNWLTYIWAVTHGHVIDASLGYFITPLVNVLLGYTVLHERLRALQWTAVAVAAAGVLWLAVLGGSLPWIALVLAATFGGYGLLRKTAPLGALEGLTLETLLLSPFALSLLAWGMLHGTGRFPAPDATTNVLLLGIGPVTAVPLLLFAAGARRIRMVTLGLLQYVAPSLQFLLGVWVFAEPFSGPRMVGFCLIWLALVIYSVEGWRQTQSQAARPEPVLE